jgi:hypothetical protein
MQTAPLFGIVTASIFEDAKNPESELSKKLNGENRPIDRWYPEVIHESANAFYGIETIFQELGERCKSEDQKRQLKPFLEAWKKQLQMYVLDCVNLLNGYVMHLKKEDCAVIYSTTDFQVHMEKFGQIQKRLLQLQAHKVYSKKTEKDHVNYCGLFSNLAKFNPDFSRQGRTNVSVPTMISAMDVCRLVYFLSEFFENIRNGLQANKKLYVNSCVGDTAKYLPLMSRSRQKLATIQLRPEEDDNGQARINLIGENHFRGFGLRVDRDKTDDREHLTLDIGSADLEHALDYAKSLGEMSDQHEIVMNYSKIYGARDAGAPEPKYPSVFDMKINGTAGKPYTLGNKVALVSAVAMKNATVNGLRKSEIYLHHSRDPEIAAFTKDFPQIVRMLGEVLTGR